jgi:hypothetical protein
MGDVRFLKVYNSQLLLITDISPFIPLLRFIGQLTLARFRGETAFGWVARVRSTFIGACVGLAIW